MIKTRFAPSPTGAMHIGNLRTALVNALFAHSQGGSWLLRIEDTDRERSEARYVDKLQADLLWLGLKWDEGPVYQSDRDAIYAGYYDQLIAQGLAYPCYCSQTELTMARKTQLSAGIAPRYMGTCRHLTPEQCAEKEAAGLKPSLRLRVPEGKWIRFEDLIFGPKQFLSDDLGDFIIRKQDGGPTFMFCNAVDDALMGVTHALRGEDHVTNTPRQLLILELLGLRAPQYGHFPIILGLDGKPLSKRNGSQSVEQLREQNFLPEAVLNYIARLGHSYAENAYYDIKGLAEHFSLSRVGKAPAKFDSAQIDYWQDQCWQHFSSERLNDALSAYADKIPENERAQALQVLRQNIHFASDLSMWVEALYSAKLELSDESVDIIRQAPGNFFELAVHHAQQGEGLKDIIAAVKNELGIKGKALFMPFRLALTNQNKGPTFDELSLLMSADTLVARFAQAKKIQQES